jgi:hypothetical protein
MVSTTPNGAAYGASGQYRFFSELPTDPHERRQVFNDWVCSEPASRDAAIVERRDQIRQKQQIESQLGDCEYQAKHLMDDVQYLTWKGKAKRSLSLRESRMGFLREWLRQHPEPRAPRDVMQASSPTQTLRLAVQVVGQLEAVYRAAVNWLDDPDQTDATQQALVDEIEYARMTIGEMIV